MRRRKILIKLQGGLGNQMFQYALGRSLSFLHHDELLLDDAFFKFSRSNPNTTTRELALNDFPDVKARIAQKNEIDDFNLRIQQQGDSLFSRLKFKLNPFYKVNEQGFAFDKRILALKGNLYLEGYWQSEKYFMKIRDSLLREFQPQITHNNLYNDYFQKISTTNSVSIHVRRGDYVSDPKTSAWHGAISAEYYYQAIDSMSHAYGDCQYFLFSDDPEWVLTNWDMPENIIAVSGQGLNAVEELSLMTHCTHNIIANSSYSWWGAWLNQNVQKKVIAPLIWFQESSIDTSTMCPENWEKI